MRANPNDIKQVMDMLVNYLVSYLCEKEKMNANEALSTVMGSQTYASLMDKRLKYYCESKECILDMFVTELSERELSERAENNKK